jgi:hypothetical protein
MDTYRGRCDKTQRGRLSTAVGAASLWEPEPMNTGSSSPVVPPDPPNNGV